jgi:transmembrane sensor
MTSSREIESRAAEWLAKEDGGNWSEATRHELLAWLDASTAHRVAYLRLKSVWARADALRVDLLTHEPRAELLRPVITPRQRFGHWRAAAAALLAVGLSLGGMGLWRGSPAGEEHRTAVGARLPLALADGSSVLLNTDTRLRVSMSADVRMVRLDQGEAYFEVAHNSAQPFVVEAAGQRITVLGTKFSVRRDADNVQVRVVEGRVKVQNAGIFSADQGKVLERNEVALKSSGALQVFSRPETRLADDLSWRAGRIVFDRTTLADAATEFNRYNDRKLSIADTATAAIRIGGRFEVANVDAFARLLREGFGVEVREIDGDIVISAARTGF